MPRASRTTLAGVVIASALAASAQAQEAMHIIAMKDIPWQPCDPSAKDPAACQLAYVNGDPGKEPNHKYVKAKGGFVLGPHWHTGNETIVITKGVVHIAAEGGQEKDAVLNVGDYLRIPARRVHWASCPVECIFYLYVDGPDSYIDANAKRP